MRRELLLIEEMIGAATVAHSLVAGISVDDLEADRQRRDALAIVAGQYLGLGLLVFVPWTLTSTYAAYRDIFMPVESATP